MNSKKLVQIIICLTVAIAILVPALTLFNWGDYLYCSFDAPANQKMIIEVIVLAVLIGAISFLVKRQRTRLILLGVLTLLFSYIHSMLLPVAVAGIYFLAVMSIGNLLTGISAVIIAQGLLSLVGWGTPKKLGIAVLIMAILYTTYRILYMKNSLPFHEKRQKSKQSKDCQNEDSFCIFSRMKRLSPKTTKWQLLVNAVVLLVVLVQIGRATVAVKDFDSLWYGLRSAHVLAPGGNIFENLGLVGMVYTYSKGYEILTLPLSAFRSYAYIPVFNTCLFIAGLGYTWKLVNTMCGRDTQRQADNVCAVKTHDKLSEKCSINEYDRTSVIFAYMAVIITAVIPGIVNMCVSAKPDMVTWMLQMIMIERFFVFVGAPNGMPVDALGNESGTTVYVNNGSNVTTYNGKAYKTARLTIFLEILTAYLLSLCMKPTAVIFSTALAGMMLIWWIVDTIIQQSKKADKEVVYTGTATEIATGITEDMTVSKNTDVVCTGVGNSLRRCLLSKKIVSSVAALVALCIVWGRTIKLTGLPFMSVFTGLFTSLGFTLKYPFSASSIPTRFKGDNIVTLVGKRAAKMLISPEGSDMGHVSIAWGGSIMLVLGVIIIICIIVLIAVSLNKRRHKETTGEITADETASATASEITLGMETTATIGTMAGRITGAAATVFIPYAMISAATLAMLSQVDGNYYMTLYSIVIVTAMWLSYMAVCTHSFEKETCIPQTITDGEPSGQACMGEPSGQTCMGQPEGQACMGQPSGQTCMRPPVAITIAAIAIIAFQFFIVLLTNWASAAGFTPIAFNRLSYDNRKDNRISMTAQASPEDIATGNTIYDKLAAQPEARVLAVAAHPFCLQYECVVQSYSDMANPWGNPELENSLEEFVDYLHFAKVDYIYADMDYLSDDAYSWRRGLLDEMKAQGLLYDFFYEENTYLARVK